MEIETSRHRYQPARRISHQRTSRVISIAIGVLLLLATRSGSGFTDNRATSAAIVRRVDFAGYTGGSVEDWLKKQSYQFESDAKQPDHLGLAISDGVLSLEAKRAMSGIILNDAINLDGIRWVRINWGVKRYPKDVSYANQVNNEPLMIYFFFGKDKIFSGHLLIPNSPYFIGLFLCQDEKINHPYKGRYYHASGRFVCLGKPAPGEMITSEFDLDSAFRNYFGQKQTPSLTGISFGVDTSKAGDGGQAEALIKSIEFLDSH